MQFDLVPGDTVLLVFSERSIDKWAQQGGEVDPLDSRLHHLSDPVALPGLLSLNKAWQGAGKPSIGVQEGPLVTFDGSNITLDGGTLPVARQSDPVQVTIPASSVFIPNPSGAPILNPSPIPLSGTITGPCAPRVKG